MLGAMHFVLQKYYDMYHYVDYIMTFIASVYLTELVGIIGEEHFSNCIMVLFTYTIGISTNLSSNWKHTTLSLLVNISYYFIRLGIRFTHFPLSMIATCILC